MKLITLGLAGVLGMQLVGCASVSNGTTQAIRVETLATNGTPVEGAQCSLTNDSGSFNVTTPGSMFGNILLGGGVGAIVDHSNGSAYNYPEWIRLVSGQNLTFDRSDFKSGEATAPHQTTEVASKK